MSGDSEHAPPADGEVVDGVHRYAPTGLRVVIVGAGLGGLLAALECWRKGHEVQVLEKAPGLSEAGDVVGIGPNGHCTIPAYPSLFAEWRARLSHRLDMNFCYPDGRAAMPWVMEYNKPGAPPHALQPAAEKVGSIHFRRDMALAYAAQCARLGIPVRFGVDVRAYEESAEDATAVAADGTRYEGHVVVAADGLGTKSHAMVMGHDMRAVSTGYVADRIAYPVSALKDAPETKKLLVELEAGRQPIGKMLNGHHMHIVYVLVKDRVCVVMTHHDDGTTAATETWGANITPAQMAAALPAQPPAPAEAWDPLLLEAIANIPADAPLVRWKLCWRDPQARWTSAQGRVVQLGDAAHSFLPTSGNGAAMALEDAVSLAECLRLAVVESTTEEGLAAGKDGAGGLGRAVATATRVHEKLRFERTAVIQRTGFVNRATMHNMSMEDIKRSGRNPLHYGRWIWSHHAERYARENFAAARAHVEDPARHPFANTNLPPGHKFEPWTMAGELAREEEGRYTQELKENGDWGAQTFEAKGVKAA